MPSLHRLSIGDAPPAPPAAAQVGTVIERYFECELRLAPVDSAFLPKGVRPGLRLVTPPPRAFAGSMDLVLCCTVTEVADAAIRTLLGAACAKRIDDALRNAALQRDALRVSQPPQQVEITSSFYPEESTTTFYWYTSNDGQYVAMSRMMQNLGGLLGLADEAFGPPKQTVVFHTHANNAVAEAEYLRAYNHAKPVMHFEEMVDGDNIADFVPLMFYHAN